MTFSYSFKREDKDDILFNFDVTLNGDETPSKQYGIYPDTDEVKCATDCLKVSGGDVVHFRCVNENQECRMDNVRFWGAPPPPTSSPSAGPTLPPPTTSPTLPVSSTPLYVERMFSINCNSQMQFCSLEYPHPGSNSLAQFTNSLSVATYS